MYADGCDADGIECEDDPSILDSSCSPWPILMIMDFFSLSLDPSRTAKRMKIYSNLP